MSKPTFTTRLTAALSIIGVAIGLGNVWRFPYMMGKFGGSAFLFIYIIFVFVFSIPALMGELSLGRQTGKGPVGAFSETFNPVLGKIFAYTISTALLVANAYYLVVIANIIYLTFFSAFKGFGNETSALSSSLDNSVLQFTISVSVLVMVVLVVLQGLKKGIERISKIFVPFFGLVMIYLLFHVLSLPKAIDKLLTFLHPDFTQLSIKNIFAAMGQAFFSLTLGGTILVVYGSYLKKTESIPKVAIFSGLGDLSASILVSLILVPAILIYGLNIEEGHTLLFSTLPVLFEQMPAGRVIGTFFLFSLTLIAFLSSTAAVQYLSSTLSNNSKIGFKKSVIVIGLFDLLLIIPCAFYSDIIPVLDLIFGSGMQVLGSCLAIISLCWFIGRKKAIFQIFGTSNNRFNVYLFRWIKWAIPAALILTLCLYIIDNMM